MSAPESVLRLVVKRFGGQLTETGDWRRSCGMEEGKAKSLSAQLQLRHFQVRGVVQAKDGTWEVVFR